MAVLLDQQLRTQLAGDPAVNVRDHTTATTMSWLPSRIDARVILIAANSHIQRVPVVAGPYTFPVLGQHLAASLGPSYVSIGMTTATGTTVTRRGPRPSGRLRDRGGRPPAGPRGQRRGDPGPGLHRLSPSSPAGARIRSLDNFAEVAVAAAFDAVVCLPAT
jgi:erythromycin esterase